MPALLLLLPLLLLFDAHPPDLPALLPPPPVLDDISDVVRLDSVFLLVPADLFFFCPLKTSSSPLALAFASFWKYF